MKKVFYFEVSGKLESESEEEAICLLHEFLSGRTQFQIESLEEED